MERPSPQSATHEQSATKKQSATNKQSPLLGLAAELRNTIYELVAGTADDKTIIFEYNTAVNLHVNLGAVNRQLRDEYLPIFYDKVKKMNCIEAKVHELDLGGVTSLVDALPASCCGALAATFVFAKPGATVDKEAIARWAKTAARHRVADPGHRDATPVFYKVEVDWRHCDLTDFDYINYVLWQLVDPAKTLDEGIRAELNNIRDALWDVTGRREQELAAEYERELEYLDLMHESM